MAAKAAAKWFQYFVFFLFQLLFVATFSPDFLKPYRLMHTNLPFGSAAAAAAVSFTN